MQGAPPPSAGTHASGEQATLAPGAAASGETVATHIPHVVRRRPFAGSFLLPVLRPGAALRRLLVPVFLVFNGFVLGVHLSNMGAPPWAIALAAGMIVAFAIGAMAASWLRYCALDGGRHDLSVRVDLPSTILSGALFLVFGTGMLAIVAGQALGLSEEQLAFLLLAHLALAALIAVMFGFALPALVLGVAGALGLGLRTPWRVRALVLAQCGIMLLGVELLLGALRLADAQTEGLVNLAIFVALLAGLLALLVFPVSGYLMLAFLKHRPTLAARHIEALRQGVRRDGDKILLTPNPDRAVTGLAAFVLLTVWLGVLVVAVVPDLWSAPGLWGYLDGLSASVLGVALPVGYGARLLFAVLSILLLAVVLHWVSVLALQLIDGDRFECDDSHFSWIGASLRYVVPLSAIEAVELRRVAGSRMLAIRLRSIEPAALEGMIVQTGEDSAPRRFFMALHGLSLWVLLRARAVMRLRNDRLQLFRGEVIDLDSSDHAQMLAKICELNEKLAGAHLFLPSSYAVVTTREFARELRDRVARNGVVAAPVSIPSAGRLVSRR